MLERGATVCPRPLSRPTVWQENKSDSGSFKTMIKHLYLFPVQPKGTHTAFVDFSFHLGLTRTSNRHLLSCTVNHTERMVLACHKHTKDTEATWSDRHTKRSGNRHHVALTKPSPAILRPLLLPYPDVYNLHSVKNLQHVLPCLLTSVMSSLASNKLQRRNKTLKQKKG